METTKRTLVVQTDRRTIWCSVVRIERTDDPHTWDVVVNADGWLAGGHYPHCTIRKGEAATPGAYTVVDYIVGKGQSYVHIKGLFRPDAPSSNWVARAMRTGGE